MYTLMSKQMDTTVHLKHLLEMNQYDEAIQNLLMVLDFHPFQLVAVTLNPHLHRR